MATVSAEPPEEPPAVRSRLRWIALVTTACTMTLLVTAAGTVIGSSITLPELSSSGDFVVGIAAFLGLAVLVDLFIVNGHPSSEGDTLKYHGH